MDDCVLGIKQKKKCKKQIVWRTVLLEKIRVTQSNCKKYIYALYFEN